MFKSVWLKNKGLIKGSRPAGGGGTKQGRAEAGRGGQDRATLISAESVKSEQEIIGYKR